MEAPATVEAAAILLAAGRSERMGVSKALLPWAGLPLVAHQVRVLAECRLIDEIVVVTGHNPAKVEAALAGTRARTVYNERFESGRASSIVSGVRALRAGPAGVLIASVDQPLRAELAADLLAAWAADPDWIVRPVHQGKHGHPVIFPARLRDELELVSEVAEGLRALMRRHRDQVRDVPVADAAALLNLNTRADYEAALKRFGQTG